MKEVTGLADAWARELGKTGYDKDNELAALITKTFSPEVVTAPSALIERMFDQSTIGEFDDYRIEKAPKNTIQVYDAVAGGNVDRSYIDHTVLTPTWRTLQAETDISLQALRMNGFKTVAELLNYINEALEQRKLSVIFGIVDTAITSSHAGYIDGTAATDPSDTVVKSLALYLNDVTDGEVPFIFGLNKYMQVISGLPGVTTYLTDTVKNQYNTTGRISNYAGCDLIGFSGQKKQADGTLAIPNKKIFGVAGKIGDAITRGETRVLQNTDINSEKIHIKVGGYTFGALIKDIDKVGKIALKTN
ncbi:MAG: hypothetical protein RR015_06580 [Bacteroidales bacterium]